MRNRMIFGLLGLVIALALLVSMAVLTMSENRVFVPDDPVRVVYLPEEAVPRPSCGSAEPIHSLIDESRHCETDADCTFAGFGCPFGCWETVNVAQVDTIKKAVAEYRKDCSSCLYRCMRRAESLVPRCIERRCMAMRETIDLWPNTRPEVDSQAI